MSKHMVGHSLLEPLCNPYALRPATDQITYIRDKVTCVACLNRMPDGADAKAAERGRLPRRLARRQVRRNLTGPLTDRLWRALWK